MPHAAVVNGPPIGSYHSMLRTTCVAIDDRGRARGESALPQRVGTNVNCRIFPGHTPVEIQQQLAASDRQSGQISIDLARKDKPLAKSRRSTRPSSARWKN